MPREPLVGKWFSESAMPIGGKVPDGSERIQDIGRHAELIVKSNRSFVLKLGSSVSGKWTKSKDNYVFTPYVKWGARSTPFNGSLSKDGRTLTVKGDPSHPFWNGPLTINFHRGARD
jgi:hypothetical protein